jgi:hypothetical protein
MSPNVENCPRICLQGLRKPAGKPRPVSPARIQPGTTRIPMLNLVATGGRHRDTACSTERGARARRDACSGTWPVPVAGAMTRPTIRLSTGRLRLLRQP